MTFLRLLLGVISGIVATGPMSAAMVWLHRHLPGHERYPLPPREITTKALSFFTDPHDLSAESRVALTWLAHFGYGGAAGALYVAADRLPVRAAMARGSLLGLFVWAFSYLVLLPAFRVLTPATNHPVRRSALMIGAHLLWGCVLAVLYRTLFSDLKKQSAAFDVSPHPHRDTPTKAGKS
jgi:uncharacterized membrane protein YagU involved in acid resistance